MTQQARFITLEGIDGAGKSSHINSIKHWITQRGVDLVTTREPGGTPFGEYLRSLVLHEKMDVMSETLIMFAARNEHIKQVIEPALKAGKWVLSDRFTDASFAYQGGGRQIPWDVLNTLTQWVEARVPDLTLLFDLDPAIARQRVSQVSPQPDRFEQEQAHFFNRVREAYLQRARDYPERIVVVNSAIELSQLNACVMAILNERLW
ncbi:MAG: dTMP kinase [Ferrovum sp. 37-45-19]|uniref:dTMP kinase n=1 Tax=Ferrovum sp. JA12 TaxID=1356299 RepID=UPI00070326E7|nr:dTMP kinase [Ferrovum sp. JA12]OYV80344.1 MAG: dTMP kinase [Ferrovum sp. 21-44-67]OYV95088.1 MAG: dTMP kinase [Ferrovum sp. 37-45-19]OZB31814.1 MAG: dTMP kinase [Ferrovum sp. 34-44-207]HQT80848.1 dTMP kinase [Ferrovaceae bacterium]KRH78689.1 thymidylate kinase [Ferrovum sp. JA12]